MDPFDKNSFLLNTMRLGLWYVTIKESVRLLVRRPLIMQDRAFVRIIIILAALNGIHVLYIAQIARNLPSVIVLHSNIYFGIDFIGSWYAVFTLPLVTVVMSVVHYGLAGNMYARDRMLSYFLMISAVFLTVILLIGSVLIVSINT